MIFRMPYGKEGMVVTLPEKYISILPPPKTIEPPAVDLTSAALENPIGSPPFQEVISGKKSAIIAITDHQRAGAYQKEILNDILMNT